MDDLISRQSAIDAIRGEIEINGYSHVVDVLEQMPSAQPDLSEYSDKLWRAAYERGKKEAQPEIIRCKDCKHKPYPSDNYDYGNGDCGFEIIFPDYRCPCRCDDEYYNCIPDDDWFCGNAERRTDEQTD